MFTYSFFLKIFVSHYLRTVGLLFEKINHCSAWLVGCKLPVCILMRLLVGRWVRPR